MYTLHMKYDVMRYVRSVFTLNKRDYLLKKLIEEHLDKKEKKERNKFLFQKYMMYMMNYELLSKINNFEEEFAEAQQNGVIEKMIQVRISMYLKCNNVMMRALCRRKVAI